jgi:hypothetical protein
MSVGYERSKNEMYYAKSSILTLDFVTPLIGR